MKSVLNKKGAASLGKVSKKLKREKKRSGLLTKLTASHEAKEKVRQAKIRSQKAIVGDMDPLLSALTDINEGLVKQQTTAHENVSMSKPPGKKKSSSERKRIAAD